MPTIGELLVGVGLDAKDLDKGLAKLQRQLKTASELLTKVGKTFTLAISAPLTGIAVAAFRSSDQVSKAFADMKNSVTNSLSILGNEIAKTIDLQGILKAFADTVSGLVNSFRNFSPIVKDIIVFFAGLAIVLGPLIFIAGKLLGIAASLIVVLKAFGLTVASLAVVLNPIVLAITAISVGLGFLGFKLLTAKTSMDETGKAAVALKSRLKELNQPIKEEDIVASFDTFRRAIGLNQAEFQVFLNNMDGFVSRTFKQSQALKQHLGAFKEFIGAHTTEIRNSKALFAAGLTNIFPSGGEQFFAAINNGLQEFNQGMINAASAGNTIFVNSLTKIGDGIFALGEKARILREQTFGSQFTEMVKSLEVTATTAVNGIRDIITTVIQGISDAVATAIVEGGNLSDIFRGLLKSVAKFVIATLVQLALQYVIFNVLLHALALTAFQTEVGVQAGIAAAAAFVHVVKDYGPLVAAIIGPPIALGIAALTTGLAAAGAGIGRGVAVAGLAEGGIALGPTLVQVGETPRSRPEVIAPLDKLQAMLEFGSYTNIIELDGEVIARSTIRKLPGALRSKGLARS